MRITLHPAAALIGACLAAASMPALSMTMGEVEVVCPIDGRKFKALTAFSGTRFGMGLDLKPLGPTPAPWPLARCPGNGFVIYKKDFSADEVDRLRSFVGSEEYRALVPAHTNYFLAARLKAAMAEAPSSVANALLQATWEARTPAQYQAYAAAALAAYEQVLLAPPQDEDEALTATLVAGELERRLGLFDKAHARFLAIPGRDKLRAPMDRIVKLQLLLIEQRNSEPAQIPSE